MVRAVVEPNIMFSSKQAVLGNFIVLSKHGDRVSVTAGKWRIMRVLRLSGHVQVQRPAASTPTCSAPSSTTPGTWSW